jgi:hypothetical protein
MPILPAQSLLPLLLLLAVMSAASLYALAALGHFPRSTRHVSLAPSLGNVVLWGSIAAVVISVPIAVVAAWSLIPWYAAIIAAGAGILVAPLLLQYFSDEFVDGWRALIWFSGATVAPAIALAWQLAR